VRRTEYHRLAGKDRTFIKCIAPGSLDTSLNC